MNLFLHILQLNSADRYSQLTLKEKMDLACADSARRQLKSFTFHYLALKEVLPTLLRPTTPHEAEIPNQVAHTEDLDFIRQNYADINKIQEILLKNTNLKLTWTKYRTHQYEKVKKNGKK